MQLIVFLLNFIFDAYAFLLLLRFLLEWQRASWYNPLVRFCVQMTDPVVRPTRRFMLNIFGIDFSVFVLAWLVECIEMYALILLQWHYFPHFLGLALFALLSLVSKFIHIFVFSILISAVFSWFPIGYGNPVAEVAGLLAAPIVDRIRRMVPPMAGLDLSPMIGIFALYVLAQFVVSPLLLRVLRLNFFGA